MNDGVRGFVDHLVIAARPTGGRATDPEVGSIDHLRASFARAAAASDRAVGLWLARNPSAIADGIRISAADRSPGELRALRAITRASLTSYVRRLRDEGATPERMLVLVKEATGPGAIRGFGAQELTSDVVRWSIEAYFDD